MAACAIAYARAPSGRLSPGCCALVGRPSSWALPHGATSFEGARERLERGMSLGDRRSWQPEAPLISCPRGGGMATVRRRVWELRRPGGADLSDRPLGPRRSAPFRRPPAPEPRQDPAGGPL